MYAFCHILASGLQCYGGSGAPEQCLGICGTMTALEDGTTTDGQQVKNGGELAKLENLLNTVKPA